MADTPTPRSLPQTLGDMFDAFLSNQGIRSLRAGNPIVSLLEAAAQSDVRNSQDTFMLLASVDLDNATGLALAHIGLSEGLPKIQVSPATGLVTIADTSFTKISTKLFQGLAAPIVGTITLNVVDASSFPSTGSVYLGRGTVNYEGPIPYTATTNIGDHWQLTLSVGTTKFHNTFETCVLAQGGNRVIGANTIVSTPQANVSNAISFQTLFQLQLADGETSLPNVAVVAQTPGIIGNAIAGSISVFSSPPFSGAAVTNPSPFTNGQETESDDDYRDRIRAVRASRQLGTTLAIETAVTGITAPDENKRVNSAKLVKKFGFAATLYIDDGTGYEEVTAPVPLEFLMDSAIGGEPQFETTQRPVARAYALTTNVAPFVLRATDQLSVRVGGVIYTHAFNTADFQTISNASAFEVVASINSDPGVAFVARTVASGTQVAIFANVDTNEDIEVLEVDDSTDANDGLGFPLGRNFTMQLFKNDRLLTKDGIVATYSSQAFATWSPVTGSQTLTVSVDNTPDITYTFIDQDFIDAGTGFPALSRATLAAWALVINAKIPGLTATINNGRLVLTSNAGPTARAAISISSGTLVDAHFFAAGGAVGAASDYTLDRNEGQISLSTALAAGDQLSAGTTATRAFIQSGPIGTVAVGSPAKLWFVADGAAQLVQTGFASTVPIAIAVDTIHDWGHLLSLTAGSNIFSNVTDGDWIVLWDSNLPAALQGVFRVASADPNQIFIERHTAATRRYSHRSVTIASTSSAPCKVLTAGGAVGLTGNPDGSPTFVLGTCEIFDPATQLTTPTGMLNHPRSRFAMVQGQNGKVYAAGGLGDGVVLGSIEIYDPTTGAWTMSAASLTTPVWNLTGTLLANGKIAFIGGDPTNRHATTQIQVYDPTADTLTGVQALAEARAYHQAVLLPGGTTILVIGGYDNSGADKATCEIYNGGTGLSTLTGAMPVARSGFGAALVGLTPTKAIAIGNNFTAGVSGDKYTLYDISGGTWGASTTIPNDVLFENKDVVQLTNGNVVGLHGTNTADNTESAGFVYDGSTFTAVTPDSLSHEFAARWLSTYVEIKNNTGSIKNIVAGFDGNYFHSEQFGFQPTAVIEIYDPGVDQWTVPDPAAVGSVSLLQTGAAVVSTNQEVKDVVVAPGSNYTASSLVDALNAGLDGATASIYRTSALRVRTNSYLAGRDLALVTQNVAANALQLTPASFVPNLADHIGTAESGNGDNGTPTFEDMRVVSGATGINQPCAVVSSSVGGADRQLIGTRNAIRGSLGSDNFHPDPWASQRANNNYRYRSTLFASTPIVGPVLTFLASLEPREAPQEPWGPWDNAYLGAPLAIGIQSTLGVMVDNDIAEQFSIPMWRTLKTVGNTYGATNTFKDGDAGVASIAATFGLDYDFNDFAVYMTARATSYTDASMSMLFRYYRPGPDGNGARVRVGNPLAPNQALSVATVLDTSGNTNITIRMGSGATRNLTVHNSTRIGYNVTSVSGGQASIVETLNLLVSSAQRTSNVTTLTLTLPAGITDHGLAIGNNVWLASTSVDFPSGVKSITGRSATTITYAEVASNVGPDANIGTLSFDSQGEATWLGSGAVVSDLFRLNLTSGVTYNDNTTFRVEFVSNQYLQVESGDQVSGLTLGSGVLIWQPIQLTTNLQIFSNIGDTAASFAGKVNALAALPNSTCPITVTVIGTGTGLIVENTPDFYGQASMWYVLADGVNWVQVTTAPGSVAGDYQLTFKNPITGTLATGADWTNEVVRIVPITAKDVVEWLNTPSVTGLFTVADIETSNDGANVQISTLTPGSIGGIQVQGGLSNAVIVPVVGSPQNLTTTSASTILTSDSAGILAGMWARIENTNTLPKPLVFAPGLVLTSWTPDGRMTFSGPVVSRIANLENVKFKFEKQGNFVAISDLGFGVLNAGNWGNLQPGTWIYITPATSPEIAQVSGGNQGLFQIVRGGAATADTGGVVFLENQGFAEEVCECNVQTFTASLSVMPGDKISALSPLWGIGNQGTWTVKTVGTTTADSNDLFANLNTLVVDTSSRVPIPQTSAPALTTTTAGLVYVVEGNAQVFVAKILGITPNQANGAYTDLHWDKQFSYSSISANAGSLVAILDKLAFDSNFHSGFDGYRYDTGLIGEANKVVYGDPSDVATYPGVASADAHINIQGPLVKRIQVSLSIRVKSGLNTADIETRVQSAVATVINQTPIGKSIAFSDIVDAAAGVVGVVSVTIVAPTYNVAHDQIPVQPYEKPYVLSLTQDVQVSFLGV